MNPFRTIRDLSGSREPDTPTPKPLFKLLWKLRKFGKEGCQIVIKALEEELYRGILLRRFEDMKTSLLIAPEDRMAVQAWSCRVCRTRHYPAPGEAPRAFCGDSCATWWQRKVGQPVQPQSYWCKATYNEIMGLKSGFHPIHDIDDETRKEGRFLFLVYEIVNYAEEHGCLNEEPVNSQFNQFPLWYRAAFKTSAVLYEGQLEQRIKEQFRFMKFWSGRVNSKWSPDCRATFDFEHGQFGHKADEGRTEEDDDVCVLKSRDTYQTMFISLKFPRLRTFGHDVAREGVENWVTRVKDALLVDNGFNPYYLPYGPDLKLDLSTRVLWSAPAGTPCKVRQIQIMHPVPRAWRTNKQGQTWTHYHSDLVADPTGLLDTIIWLLHHPDASVDSGTIDHWIYIQDKEGVAYRFRYAMVQDKPVLLIKTMDILQYLVNDVAKRLSKRYPIKQRPASWLMVRIEGAKAKEIMAR